MFSVTRWGAAKFPFNNPDVVGAIHMSPRLHVHMIDAIAEAETWRPMVGDDPKPVEWLPTENGFAARLGNTILVVKPILVERCEGCGAVF